MSTLTSSTFLPRNCLASYLDGKYLLAANGPFIELLDLDKARCEDYDLSKSDIVKTRVTKNSSISHILPLEKSGNVAVIARDFRRKALSLTAHIVHRDRVLNGGYEMNPSSSHLLYKKENFNKNECYGDTVARVIPNKDEFILLTSNFIARYRFSFSEDSLEAQFFQEEYVDLNPILEEYTKTPRMFVPRFVTPTVPFNFIMKSSTANENDRFLLIFVHINEHHISFGEFWVNESTKEIMVPNLGIGVICDHEFITIVKTELHQQKEEISKEQLQLLSRSVNPHFAPKKILAVEESDREMDIFIISEEGLTKSRWDGKKLKVKAAFEDDRFEEEVSSKRGSSNSDEINVEYMENGSIFKNAKIEDGIIVSNKTRNSHDLVASLKTGSIIFVPHLNHRLSVNLSLPSPLNSRPSTPADKSADVFVLGHKEDGSKFSSNVIAVNAQGVEIAVMNSKGTIYGAMNTCDEEDRENVGSILCSDVKFDSLNNSAYVLMGYRTKEMYNVYSKIIEDMSVIKNISVLSLESSAIISVSYFQNEFTKNFPNCYAVLTISKLSVYCTDQVSPFFQLVLSSSSKRKECSMLTMGDGGIVHDVWLLSESKVSLLIGRNKEYKKKTVELKFPNWKGSITASCSLSTKKSANEDYLDLIFVAKGSKLGILVALHMEDDPANVIQFTEWKMPKGSDAIGIHTELLKYEVQNDVHILDVRLYSMKKKSGTLHISVCRLIVDGSGVSVNKQSPANKFIIPTSIRNPHQIAVTNMKRIEAKPNTDPPKYVIISGSNGSQVVRICPKKQLNSIDLDKIPSSSSVEQEASDVEK